MRQHLVAVLLVSAVAAPAAAQLMLPGAVPATPAGTKEHPLEPGGRPAKPKAAAFHAPPSEETIAGKTLWLDGAATEMSFIRKDKDLMVTELGLDGELISKPGDECRVRVQPASPIAAKPAGTVAGLVRFTLDLPACPLSFDVLDGAILVPKATPVCLFKEADCKVAAAGMWGPAAAQILPAQIKELEKSRTAAEAAVQEDFRALLARTKDKQEIKQLAAAQAGFSSQREEVCRSYARDALHGFCAARFTQARVFALQAQLAESQPPPVKKRPAKARSSTSEERPKGEVGDAD